MTIPILAVVSGSAAFIPPGVGLLRFTRQSLAMKVFVAACVLSCLEIWVEYILALNHTNNLFIANYGLAFEVLSTAGVYVLALEGRRVRRLLLAIAAVFLVIWTLDKIFWDVQGQMNEEMGIASRFFIIGLSIIALHTVARRTTGFLTDEPLFWITSANILLSTGVTFLLGMSNELMQLGTDYFTAAWNINWSLEIVGYLMFAKGFLCTVTPQT